jgi:hypothetical protein
MNNSIKYAVLTAVVSLGLAVAARADLSITSGWDSSAVVQPTLLLSDFANNPSGYWTAQLGTNTGTISGANRWQAYYSGSAAWVAGANSFSFTYNPTTGVETYTANNSSGTQSLSYTTAFDKSINYVQLDIVARNGSHTTDAFSVSGLTITSLDGQTTYLQPATLSIATGGGYVNNQIDNAGVLANGFTLSGTLNLSSPANYAANQNDKFVITLGNDSSFITPSPTPEPSSLALGLSALLPLGAALRRYRAAK